MKTESAPDHSKKQPSLIVATMGTDGGITKTATANHLSDFYEENDIDIIRINCDVEKRQRGSFASFHADAINVDIRTPAGADQFMDLAETSPSRILLADLAANLGKFSLDWFEEMYEPMAALGMQFLFVGVITSSSGSVEAVLHWARTLKTRVRYLIVQNEKDGADFGYLHQTPQGKSFLEKANPAIITVKEHLFNIQAELDNRNLTLRQALNPPPDKELGPLLSKLSSQTRIRGSFGFIQKQLFAEKERLLP